MHFFIYDLVKYPNSYSLKNLWLDKGEPREEYNYDLWYLVVWTLFIGAKIF
jgi:hypothetical protein